MYFRLSNGSGGTRGSASTNQSSCQRLNMIEGRWGTWSWGASCARAGAYSATRPAMSKATREITMKLFAGQGMNFREIAAREAHHGGLATVRVVGWHEHGYSGGLGLCQCIGEVRHLVSGHFPSVRPGQMAISHHDGDLAERRFDSHAAERALRQSDVGARGAAVVGYDLAV